MTNNLDITSIETAISKIVKNSGATSNVYNNRPKSMLKVDDFAVVAVSGQVSDMGCYGVATVGIDLFAKDLNNFKNTKKLEWMYDMLMAYLPKSCRLVDADFSGADFDKSDFYVDGGEYLIDSHPTLFGDTPDDYGFTARIINFKVIIKIA